LEEETGFSSAILAGQRHTVPIFRSFLYFCFDDLRRGLDRLLFTPFPFCVGKNKARPQHRRISQRSTLSIHTFGRDRQWRKPSRVQQNIKPKVKQKKVFLNTKNFHRKISFTLEKEIKRK
jgi:hypothetical protein